jgi:HAD superfamily hydrolase (TIGR01484 family)
VLSHHADGVCIWEVQDRWYANRPLSQDEKACFLGSADSLVPIVLTEETIRELGPSKMLLPLLYDVDDLAEAFEDDLYIYRLSSSPCVEISPASVSKASGVELVAERLGLSRDELVVFGDDYNDIPMFRHCPNGVAMANAIPELMAIAADITASNDEDGVALKVEQWL